MVREETLRALISARETLSKSMRSAARSTEELRESMARTGAVAGATTASMSVVEDQLEDVTGDALAGAAALQKYRQEADDAGDESAEAAAQTAGLSAALRAVGAAAGEASVNVGPFNTSVRRAVVALPVLIALIGATTTALVGLSVAALGAAGALAMLFTGGLIGRAEEMERHSAGIESRMEAMEEIARNLGGALAQAIEPVQNMASQDAAMSMLQGFITLIGDLAESAERLQSTFGDVADRLDAVFWAEEARGIAELEKTIKDLMPMLEALTYYILANLPDFLAWLRQETLRVGPVLAQFGKQAIEAAQALSEIGGTLLRLTLPTLSILLDAIVMCLNVINAIPEPVLAAALVFSVLTVVLTAYSGTAGIAATVTGVLLAAVDALIASIATLLAPITLTVVAIAALAAAVVGIISYFGWWDDIAGAFIATWNALVEVVEFSINAIIALSNWITDLMGPLTILIPIIGPLIYLIGNWDKAMTALGQTVSWLKDLWEGFVETVMRWVDPVLEAIGLVMSDVDEAGGVQIDGAKLEQPSSGGSGSDEQTRAEADQGAGAGVRQQTGDIRESRQENNFDFSGSSFGGSTSERDIEKAVERALAKKKSRQSDT